jgi:hypothetical protein
MKTIKIDDEIHRKLTITLGTLMAQTGKPQTYQDTLKAIITQSVKLPEETLKEVENFVIENKHLGYITREEIYSRNHTLPTKAKVQRIQIYRSPKGKIRKTKPSPKGNGGLHKQAYRRGLRKI